MSKTKNRPAAQQPDAAPLTNGHAANPHHGETHHEDQPPTHQEDPIVSINEAGRLIGVSWHTVASYVNGGILNYIRYPGGKIGVRMSEVNEILRIRNVVKENKPKSATA